MIMDKIDLDPNSIELNPEKSYHSSQKWKIEVKGETEE